MPIHRYAQKHTVVHNVYAEAHAGRLHRDVLSHVLELGSCSPTQRHSSASTSILSKHTFASQQGTTSSQIYFVIQNIVY